MQGKIFFTQSKQHLPDDGHTWPSLANQLVPALDDTRVHKLLDHSANQLAT